MITLLGHSLFNAVAIWPGPNSVVEDDQNGNRKPEEGESQQEACKGEEGSDLEENGESAQSQKRRQIRK